MSGKQFELKPQDYPTYYGASDILCQITDELRNRPDSCFSQNLIAWYNAEYSALSDLEGCEYQVAINQNLCEDSEDGTPETVEDVIDVVFGFLEGKPRRVARAIIGIVCREIRRRNTIRTAPDVT